MRQSGCGSPRAPGGSLGAPGTGGASGLTQHRGSPASLVSSALEHGGGGEFHLLLPLCLPDQLLLTPPAAPQQQKREIFCRAGSPGGH